ncbi:EpsG family protein [Enterobacter asburiae]|uniref:EpsG family protein n=3 Tax=Enterobacter TaxID=547 RepID=UPI0032AEE9C9
MVYAFLTHRKQALFVSIFFTFSFIALTYPSGNDWIGYFINYDCQVNDVCQPGFVLFEPGYNFIVTTIGLLGFQAIIIFIAFINVLLIYQYAKYFDHGCFVVISIMCLFMWSIYIEAIRQALAMSIVMYSVRKLICRELKKYILLILLASTFHITALIALLFLIPVYSGKLNKILSYGLLSVSCLFFFFSNSILNFALGVLPVGSIASQKLNFYLSSDQYKPMLSIGSGSALDVIMLVLIGFSFYKVKRNLLSKHTNLNNIILLGCCLYIAFAIFIGKMMPVMTRIGWYGFPYVLILLYIHVGESFYYKKVLTARKVNFSKLFIYAYFALQIIRPFTYEHSYYNIMHQQTIFQNYDTMDDVSLRIAAKDKCLILTNMGYNYLCSI